MLECFNQLLLIEIPKLNLMVERAGNQMVVEHVYS